MGLREAIQWAKETADLAVVKQVGSPGQLVTNFPCAEVYTNSGEFDNSTVTGRLGFESHVISVAFHWPIDGIATNMAEMEELIEDFMQNVVDNEDDERIVGVESAIYDAFSGKIQTVQTHGAVFTLTINLEDNRY